MTINTIEILSTNLGHNQGKEPRVVMDVRLTPKQSFESVPLALTADQARRLHNDLGRLLELPEMNQPRADEPISLDMLPQFYKNKKVDKKKK